MNLRCDLPIFQFNLKFALYSLFRCQWYSCHVISFRFIQIYVSYPNCLNWESFSEPIKHFDIIKMSRYFLALWSCETLWELETTCGIIIADCKHYWVSSRPVSVLSDSDLTPIHSPASSFRIKLLARLPGLRTPACRLINKLCV